MPTIVLKSSGKAMAVTDEGLAKIKANPETAKLYNYPAPLPPAEEPEEITNFKNKKRKPAKNNLN